MSEARARARAEAEYHANDFEWEELQREIEQNPSLRYHLLPFHSSSSQSQQLQQQQQQPLSDSLAWGSFHSRHSSGMFFKERRYLLQEFPDLVYCRENSNVLEVGCGSGSTALPLLRGNENIIVYACDCSAQILGKAKEMIDAADVVSVKQRFHPFFCDFSLSGFPKWLACDSCRETSMQKRHYKSLDVEEKNKTCLIDQYSTKDRGCCIGGVDFITLVFTLSAVPHQIMPAVIRECFSVLKPGGLLLFRDYGLYDMTMIRFEPEKRVGFREYMRSDKTRSYFFSLDTTKDLFADAGFIQLELEYCCVKSVNRRNGKTMRRVWVHGKFQKPLLRSS